MSAESIAKALTDPVDEPEEVMAIAAAAYASSEDDALSAVHHLTGRDLVGEGCGTFNPLANDGSRGQR
jgi:hypothetical protein